MANPIPVKIAGIAEDQFVRAAYIEGLLGVPEHSISRNPKAIFKAALNELLDPSGTETPTLPTRIVDTLLSKNMSEDDVAMMIGTRDLKLRESMIAAANKAVGQTLHGSGSARVQGEEVVQSLSIGVNPVHNERITRLQGHGLFYFAGKNAGKLSSLSLASIRSFLMKVSYNLTMEILKGSRAVDSVSLQKRIDEDAPGFGADGNSPTSRNQIPDTHSPADVADAMGALFQDPEALREIDRLVRARLGGPAQQDVWSVILKDPDLIRVDGDSIGVNQADLARTLALTTGRDIQPVVAGRTFRQDVLPAMRRALSGSRLLEKFMKELAFQETYNADMMRTAASYTMKKDVRLKNGDILNQGAPVNVSFLGARDPRGSSICVLDVPGHDSVRVSISKLPDLVNGFKRPSFSALERMTDDGVSSTPTGKKVEPDGYGVDGSPSWLLVLGLI